MKTYIDQLNRTITIDDSLPLRIVSIVPSQTELLYDLGLDEEVVGITKFCIHPNEWFKNKTSIGGTKNVHLEKLKELQPTIIFANKEENTKADIEALEQIAPVWLSDIYNLDDALKMIVSIGEICDKKEKAETLANKIFKEFKSLFFGIETCKPKRSCCYLIWQNPYMSVGNNTFIHSMLEQCNFKNIFDNLERYPTINIEDMIAANPSVVMLSSEPYPFKEKHIIELQQHLPNAKIMLVDGEMFSWYGSRLLQSPKYFISLLNKLD